jgi:hypothetical protein
MFEIEGYLKAKTYQTIKQVSQLIFAERNKEKY